MPSSFGPAVKGKALNDLVQLYCSEIAPAANGSKYVLRVHDEHSDYKWLLAYPNIDVANAAASLLDWRGACRALEDFMSARPAHFKNNTLRLLSESLRVKHHLTPPYTLWGSSAVIRLSKDSLQVFRAATSELQHLP